MPPPPTNRTTNRLPLLAFFTARQSQRLRFSPLLVLLASILLLSPAPVVVRSQESPSLFVAKFDNTTSYRTNVCEQQLMLWNKTVDLPNALRGLNLTVGITQYASGKEASFFSLDDDGGIRITSPGLFAVVLDEVARRAGFEWRHSFGVYPPLDNTTDANKTWTDILLWAIDTYDVSMERWAHSIDRMAKGASFPLGWWDSSAVLGELFLTKNQQEKHVVRVWSFLEPFELVVWLCIAIAIVLTGLVYWVLEFWNKDADERDLDGKPAASVFYAALAFAGHYELRPNSHAARIVGFSFTFWALIVASAYTANLASFLVSPTVVVYKYSTMEQVLRQKAHVCIQEGAVLKLLLGNMYPNLTFVGKSSEAEIFRGLRKPIAEGGCQAVVHQYNSFELYEHTHDVNYDCAIASEKRIVTNLPAGMATIVDNGPASDLEPGGPSKCTSLISHVIDYHLTAMMNEGFLEDAWRKHLQRTATVQCSSKKKSGGDSMGFEETVSLSVHDVGGIFIVHVVLSCLAVAMATYQFYVKARSKELEAHRTLGKAFGVHQVKSMAIRPRSQGCQTSKHSILPTIPEDDCRNPEAETGFTEEESTMNDGSGTKNSSQRFLEECQSDPAAPTGQVAS